VQAAQQSTHFAVTLSRNCGGYNAPNMPFSKFRAFMKIVSIAPLLACVMLAIPAWAEKADRNKPMNVEADVLRYDDVQQTTVFTGRVVLTKGSITIRGAKLEVRQDPEGYQYGTVTGTAAELAFFRQKRDGMDEFIEGQGETLVYNGKADTVRFEKSAVLRRYRGTTLADEVSGAHILYENLTDKFSVDGSSPGATGAPKGRVRATLTPKPESAPSLPSAPRSPASSESKPQ
jgi:lipopolysaccharide export system protein LptA